MGNGAPILAFDTALGGCSVAVSGGEVEATRFIKTERDQAKLLVPVIQETLEEAGVDFKDISLIVSTIGPGSFTGLRIGLSTARSLSLALDIPVTGISTLALVARQYIETERIKTDKFAIILETKRSDYYGQVFDSKGLEDSAPFALESSDFLKKISGQSHTIGGNAVERFKAEISGEPEQGQHVYLEQVERTDALLLAWMGKEQGPQNAIEPLYLRGADVSSPNTALRVMAGSI